MPNFKYGLQYNLNRVANLLVNDIPTEDAQGAANVWAGTTGLDLLGALNYKAGTFGLGLNAVCNALAGTVNLDADAASDSFSSVSSLLAQAVFYISADGASANRQKILNQGSAGSLLDVTVGSTLGSGLRVVPADGYVYLPSVNGNYLSVPSSGTTWPTGDFDLRVKIQPDSWRPTNVNRIIAKRINNPDASFDLSLNPVGSLTIFWSSTGSNAFTKQSDAAIPSGTVGPLWVRVTLDVDNGAGGGDVKFYTSPDGSTWTQLGSTLLQTSVTSVYNSAAPVEIGSWLGGTNTPFLGRIYRAQVFNGIDGTKVLDVDCTAASTQRNTFQALTGQTVTINESGADSNDPQFLDWTGTNYIYLPGGNSANTLTITDEAALDITGDLELQWIGEYDFSLTGDGAPFISKEGTGQRSYTLRTTNGAKTAQFVWSADGTNIIIKNSTVDIPVATNGLKVTLDVDNGAAGNDVKFYYSTDLGVTWTQLGTTVTTAGTTSIFASTSNVFIGYGSISGVLKPSKLYKARILNGIGGTTVLNIDTSVITSGAATSFTALTGQTVTINRATSGRKTTVVKRPMWLFGTDDYMSVNNRWVYNDNDKYIKLPGVNGNFFTTPNSAAYNTTDLDLRVKVALDDWTPAATTTLVRRDDGDPNRQFVLRLNTDGTLTLSWYPTGYAASNISQVSSVATGVADNAVKWVRATLDVNNGAGAYEVKFYLSDDGVTWTQLGATRTGGSTTTLAAVSAFTYVSYDGATLAGRVYRVQLMSALDSSTAVLDIDTSLATPAVSTFTAVTGQTVTITGSSVDVVNGNSVYLPGVNGNQISTPSTTTLNVTGDIDLRARVAMDDWFGATSKALITKWVTVGQLSYAWGINSTGALMLYWSTDGTANLSKFSSANLPATNGQPLWVRTTLDVDNGLGQNEVKFYTSTNGTVWTQLGSTITTAGITSIFAGTSLVEIGRVSGSSWLWSGRILRAQIFNGINGTKVLDVDASVLTSVSQTTFTERSSNAATMTIDKSGTGYVSTPVLTSGYVYPTGVSNLTASAVDHLNFGATDSFTLFIAARQWSTPGNVASWLNKGKMDAAPYNGYAIHNVTTTSTVNIAAQDSSAIGASRSTSTTFGNLSNVVGVWNRGTNTLIGYLNGVATASTSIASVGSVEVTNTLRIGSRGDDLPLGAGRFNDFEVFAVAIFRRALTADEIATLNTYFQGIAA